MAGQNNRSDKLKRLVEVQRHLEQMAEIDLATATRQRQELGEAIDSTTEAINSLHPVHRNFSSIYSGRLGKLQQKDQMLANVQEMHQGRVIKERTKGDRLEEHMREARADETREADDNSIYDLIDQSFATKRSDS
ncbi:hypothetical protein [Sinorhizobium sp. BG8]|uniref:hypothetical protein n=1 Tax=Sinorhizobium sp. BG8 TaxID=2613773 RepID=UPI00193DD0F5|nr:hypothetical protein [Sinorhizobium sp. BG8]QRM54256.1 hypothetical protein F3Y30_06580 [Sinorhizobium sp. BG8]